MTLTNEPRRRTQTKQSSKPEEALPDPKSQPINNPDSDSNTRVYLRLHGQRDVVSIRVKPELKEALSEFCRANGLSLCHVFEMLVTGYLTGMQQKINWVNQSPTIELTVVRDVKRVRRYVREPEGGHDVVIEDVGSFEKCGFCGERPVAEHHEWVDRYRCIRQFTCERHHEKLKSRGISWQDLCQEAYVHE